MRKNILYSLAALMVLSMGALSCSNDEDYLATETETVDNLDYRFIAAAQEIMDNEDGKFDKGGYIIYLADEDTVGVLDVEEYSFYACLQAAFNEGSETTIKRASAQPPTGAGWKYAGTAKNFLQASKLMKTIQKSVPKDKEIEIHLDPMPDGGYKVWYKVVT